MADIAVLKVEKRSGTGKGSSRALRREGKVPAIIYSEKNSDGVAVAINAKELSRLYMKGHFTSRLLDLEFGSEKTRVIPRDIQLHPITDNPVHADFMRVNDAKKVHVLVPIRLLNREQSPGLKRGGVLNIVRRDIELICRADSIPHHLEADLTGIKIGESLHAHSIALPNGVEFAIKDRDFTVATIVGRTAEEVIPTGAPVAPEMPGEAGEGAEGAEGAEEAEEK